MTEEEIDKICNEVSFKMRKKFVKFLDPYMNNIDQKDFLMILFLSLSVFMEDMIINYSNVLEYSPLEILNAITKSTKIAIKNRITEK